MSGVVHTWLGFLALAAGLVHVALVIGSPLPVALVLLLVGAAEFAWGVFAFVWTTPPLPQLARSGALVPVIGWALLLVVAGADSFGPLTDPAGLFPMLVASVFDLLIALGLTVQLRRATAPAEPATASPARPGRHLAGVIVGALVIAAITTPALAATEAGQAAQNHGDAPAFDLSGHDH
ncbi:MAG TPA: hypothetical protein VGM70_01490 [Pseudolysinimonas sp.]|jgi:hypothetical protein